MDEEKKKKLEEQEEAWKQFQEYRWPVQHWRAWGSWFSWGSPVGLGLFFVLTAIAIGIVMWFIKL